MKLKAKDFFIYAMFFCIFFWDILEDVFSKSQLVLLILLFGMYILKCKKVKFNKNVLILFALISIHAIVNIFIGNDTFDLFILQIGSIAVCFLIFDNFIREVKMEKIITAYWNFAVFTSCIGVIEEIGAVLNLSFLTKIPLLYTYTNFNYRVMGFAKISSICREPSFLGYILAPAVCFIICYFMAPEFIDTKLPIFKNKVSIILIILAYVFTFSGVAYFGVLMMFLIVWYKKGISVKKILIPFILLALFLTAYNFIPDIQIRVDDTLAVFSDKSINGATVNLSSYTYYANWNVVQKTVTNSHWLGTGLGSYQLMFDKYNLGGWGDSGLSLNREDANSGFFRVLSELGILGILCILFYLIKFFPGRKNYNAGYSLSFLTIILMFLLRQGNYTHAGSILFILLYAKSYKELLVGNKVNK